MEKSINKNKLEGAIDRFEGDKAVIVLENGQNILWDRDNLPDGCRESSVVNLTLSTEESEQKNKEELAKEILNKLIEKD